MGMRELITAVYVLKQQEKEIKAKRAAAEAELETAIGVPQQWEGSKTQDFENYRVTVKRKIDTKVDAAKLTALLPTVDESARTAFRWKAEVEKKIFNSLSAETQAVLNDAITRTPSKVSFTIKAKED